MYCYLCGKKAAIAQKIITYTIEGTEEITVRLTHCDRQWVINADGIVTACGEVKKGESNADKETPKA